ncbi:DUF1161 domain-containing protein [Sodalis-like endosymbiont of Proechinophthirus fluctus]
MLLGAQAACKNVKANIAQKIITNGVLEFIFTLDIINKYQYD